MPDVKNTTATNDPSTLRLKLEEEGRTGARIKVVGVGGGGPQRIEQRGDVCRLVVDVRRHAHGVAAQGHGDAALAEQGLQTRGIHPLRKPQAEHVPAAPRLILHHVLQRPRLGDGIRHQCAAVRLHVFRAPPQQHLQ